MVTTPSPMSDASRGTRPFFKRRAIRILVALLVAGALWYLLVHHTSRKQKDAGTVPVKVATVTKKAVPVTIRSVGNVVAYESVAVRARLDSQVTAVHFKDGDEVKKGDLLFELDDRALKAQAAQLEANIARDRATLENAKRQAGRADALVAKGFATKASHDDTSAAVQVAQASLGASAAALDNLKVQIAYCHILSPITGRTGTINVTLGNNVKANDTQALVTINQLKPIRVQAAIPQQYFDNIRAALQAGPVTVSAARQDDTTNNAIAQGRLDYIDNAVDPSTGTFITRAGFDNADESLLPGMFVTVILTLGGETAALTVPEVAVQHGQTGDYVFVISGDKAMKRDVKTGRMSNDLAVIDSGLEEGTVIAVDGLLGLKDDTKVKILPDAPAASAPMTEVK